MNIRELIHNMLYSFFVIVTLVNLAVFFLGSWFVPDAVLHYDAFLSPLIYGLCSLPINLLMYSKKELGIPQVIVRKLLQLAVLEVLLGLLAFGSHLPEMTLAVSFGLSVLVIFILVNVILWLFNLHGARALTRDLKEFQRKEASEGIEF